LISQEQRARLGELYAQFHAALDPFHPEVRRAEKAFYEMLDTLHQTHAADVSFDEFRRFAVSECKLYLRKN
jgi:hypothetical protein